MNAIMPGFGTPASMIQVWGIEVTRERARLVKKWRCDDDLTWRGVAASASDAWGGDNGSNQLFGMELCEASALLLGENPAAEPWN